MEGLRQGCFLHEKKFRFSDPEKSLDHNHCVTFFTKTESSSRTLSTLELTCVPGNLLRNLTEYWGLTHAPWTSMQSGRSRPSCISYYYPVKRRVPRIIRQDTPQNPTRNLISYIVTCFFPQCGTCICGRLFINLAFLVTGTPIQCIPHFNCFKLSLTGFTVKNLDFQR